MSQSFINSWLYLEDVADDNIKYELCNIGIVDVIPNDIIALSLPAQEVALSPKLSYLRQSVSENGWKDIHSADLHLLLLPSGKYSVCSGGNHRSFLSKQLGIPNIKASVEIFMPHDLISSRVIEQVTVLSNEISDLMSDMRTVSKKTRNQPTNNNKYSELLVKLDTINEKIIDLEKEKNNVLYHECKRLELIK